MRAAARASAAGLVAGAVLAALGPAPAAPAAPATSGAPGGSGGSAQHPGPSRHSSDGLPGPLARPLPPGQRRVAVRTEEVTYAVARGLVYRGWTETDLRGPVRVHLLTADLARPGLRLEYADAGPVPARAPLVRMVLAEGAVAGVNGDFFDIAGTGAPLGVGVDGRVVRQGPRRGWTAALRVLGRAGTQVRRTPVTVQVLRGPRVRVDRVNTSPVPPGGVGLYTAQWGAGPGRAVLDGAPARRVREVRVRAGRVVANTRRVDAGAPIRGKVLLGRGAGARALARLRVGTALHLRVVAAADPRVAIGGSEVLLRDGAVRTFDDGELHPRTAVAVDRPSGRLLLVVVDGRSEASRGMTLVELAELLAGLGADDALNLDGGGSSTMVARQPDGTVRKVNTPSDGRQRPVPNGLVLTSRG